MSHLVLRMGNLLHFHPFSHRLAERNAPAPQDPPASIGECPHCAARDDLAFFSLSVLEPIDDRRADLEHLGLTSPKSAPVPARDESWPPRL